MQGFDGIVGHDEIIEHLQNSIRLGKVSHAYYSAVRTVRERS